MERPDRCNRITCCWQFYGKCPKYWTSEFARPNSRNCPIYMFDFLAFAGRVIIAPIKWPLYWLLCLFFKIITLL